MTDGIELQQPTEECLSPHEKVTKYGEFSPARVAGLQPYGVVVRQTHPCPPHLSSQG
jgi:hypothetical protein